MRACLAARVTPDAAPPQRASEATQALDQCGLAEVQRTATEAMRRWQSMLPRREWSEADAEAWRKLVLKTSFCFAVGDRYGGALQLDDPSRADSEADATAALRVDSWRHASKDRIPSRVAASSPASRFGSRSAGGWAAAALGQRP